MDSDYLGTGALPVPEVMFGNGKLNPSDGPLYYYTINLE